MTWTRSHPLAEPLALAEAKRHLRVDHEEEDELIASLITAARERAEAITRRAIALGEYTLHARRPRPIIELPCPPVVELVRLEYDDREGRVIIWEPEAKRLDTASTPGVLYIYDPMPADVDPGPGAFRVVFRAGYTPATLPRSIAQAMLLLVGHLYANREGGVELPEGIRALLSPYRVRLYV